MKPAHFHLNQIIDIDKWHGLQDSLSLVTKMAIITVDYKGVPVTKHSHCQSFCQAVRKDEMLSEYCQKCDARGGLEAVRINKPYIYSCHFNIVDIAIPILIDGQYVGAIMAGQIKLTDQELYLEQIVNRPENTESRAKFKALEKEYNALPQLTYDEVAKAAEMLLQLCTYIVEESIQKNATIEMYKKALSQDIPLTLPAHVPSVKAFKNMEAMQHELVNTMIDSKIKKFTTHDFHTLNPLLTPAFEYIYHHKNENITLQQMAKLCHVSPSYFSRIFTKETGENFSVFVPRLKMEWAKQLLEETDLPIHRISEDLGYTDAGYFIKTFKKLEGVTPAVYRRMIR